MIPVNNTGSGRIAIPFSRKKLSRLLIISAVFAVLGCWILLTPINEGTGLLNHPIIRNGSALCALLLGLLGTGLAIRKLLQHQPALMIDDEGITDHSSPVAAGYIPWSDVQLITTTTVVNQKLILLIIRNAEAYILQQKNIIARKGMRMNFKNYGSPVCISASGLQCTAGELEQLIERKLSAYKRAGAAYPI
ncbi:STM3941 family protein [uncultured Chitinophaga sp.]|jgi:hypothetical protein|uniref:STM3941 family protein n=1 Tax=uncultured Chitinophaga sp. TaxID=339340 RepID=UPI00261AE0FC|nr:STM3941 family protein [uncultured Chitinophaga sp.]